MKPEYISNNLLDYDGELYLIKGFYSADQGWELFQMLLQSLAWQQERLFIYGRHISVPRLMCWYGDEGADYYYSGAQHKPLPWVEPLRAIKEKIERHYGCSFNSVMANLYRHGADSMGCHADDEKELGENPVIASLSLGEQRLLKFRHNKTKQVVDVVLSHCDLLLMTGKIQHHWKHELPKTKKKKAQRINLTFRRMIVRH